jgi:hypothetical protein
MEINKVTFNRLAKAVQLPSFCLASVNDSSQLARFSGFENMIDTVSVPFL